MQLLELHFNNEGVFPYLCSLCISDKDRKTGLLLTLFMVIGGFVLCWYMGTLKNSLESSSLSLNVKNGAPLENFDSILC